MAKRRAGLVAVLVFGTLVVGESGSGASLPTVNVSTHRVECYTGSGAITYPTVLVGNGTPGVTSIVAKVRFTLDACHDQNDPSVHLGVSTLSGTLTTTWTAGSGCQPDGSPIYSAPGSGSDPCHALRYGLADLPTDNYGNFGADACIGILSERGRPVADSAFTGAVTWKTDFSSPRITPNKTTITGTQPTAYEGTDLAGLYMPYAAATTTSAGAFQGFYGYATWVLDYGLIAYDNSCFRNGIEGPGIKKLPIGRAGAHFG